MSSSDVISAKRAFTNGGNLYAAGHDDSVKLPVAELTGAKLQGANSSVVVTSSRDGHVYVCAATDENITKLKLN